MSPTQMDTITERNLADFSDLFKDAHGFRPSTLYGWFRDLSHEQQALEIERVAQEVREAIAADETPEFPIEDIGWEDSYDERYEVS